MATYIDMTGWILSEHGVPDSNIIAIKKASKEEKLNNNINNDGTYWWCICKNHLNMQPELLNGAFIRNGKIKNCSCCNPNKRTEYVDMSGWILSEHGFSNNPIKIIKRSAQKTKGHTLYWECCCIKHPNQENFIASRDSILKNDCYTCPQCNKERKVIDMTGWVLSEHGYPNSNIKIIKPATKEEQNQYKSRGQYWWCQCLDHLDRPLELILGTSLRNGDTQHCSCCKIKSRGEEKIKNILEKNNIFYEKEKAFNNFRYAKSNKLVRFDFYVNNKYIIEFDGKQHFEASGFGWNSIEYLEKTQERDKLRNQYCKDNNIPLIRIPYIHLDKLCLEDLLLETTQFRVC